ncbi:MAG: hypothetical protein H7287_12515 [Thermoleophilia bacterium]|nr:hypothetical protein [Thermoleophilia bacterium]
MHSTNTPSKPTLSHQEAIRLPFQEVAERLRGLLGNRLVAYIGGVKETRAVRQWADGERAPSEAVQQRLRHALMAASMISERDTASIVQSWFQGANPKLEFRAPARVLRDADDQQQAFSDVLAAAHAFIVSA